MNKNVLIVLAGGFVVAILVAVLVQASLGGKKTEDTGPKTQVLVAARELSIGTELKDGDLKWQSWPGSAFSGAIVRKDEQKAEEALTGRLVQRVSSGQPVLSSYVFKEGRGNLVAATLGKGMRAMAIPVKADTMAGGFVTPGDYVDVILTYTVDTNTRENPGVQSLVNRDASETILQKIKVLAVDQEAKREDDEKGKVARTVTLEVSPAGSERLALAANMGDITLALRGIGDDTINEAGTSTTDVGVSRVMQDMVKMQDSPGGNIRVYNGPAMEEVRARGGQIINNGTVMTGKNNQTETIESGDQGQADNSAQEIEGEQP